MEKQAYSPLIYRIHLIKHTVHTSQSFENRPDLDQLASLLIRIHAVLHLHGESRSVPTCTQKLMCVELGPTSTCIGSLAT